MACWPSRTTRKAPKAHLRQSALREDRCGGAEDTTDRCARRDHQHDLFSTSHSEPSRKGITLRKLSDHVRAFVSDYYKQNPVNAYGRIDSPWSLDDNVPGTGGLRRIDTVSEPLW